MTKLKVNDDGLNWITEPYHRRSDEEHTKRTAMVEAYVKANACRYAPGKSTDEVTARPQFDDKHKFTPTERITLDYRGKF